MPIGPYPAGWTFDGFRPELTAVRLPYPVVQTSP
jgi:hypothetical protein